jgi:RNA polymerase sigma-70 factor (ECF subfamily)
MANDDANELVAEWFHRHHEWLVRDLTSQFGTPAEDARDLVQQAFMKVLASIDRYRGGSAGALLRRAAHNLAKNQHRNQRAKKRDVVLKAVDDEPLPDHDRTPEGELIHREELEAFHARYQRALREMPELTRQAFLLLLKRKTYKEIERILQLTPDAVKTRLRNARRRLRERVGTVPPDIEWGEIAGEEDADDHEA